MSASSSTLPLRKVLLHFLSQLFVELSLKLGSPEHFRDARFAGTLDDFWNPVTHSFVVHFHRQPPPFPNAAPTIPGGDGLQVAGPVQPSRC